MSIEIKGEEMLLAKLRALVELAPDAGAAALYEEGLAVDANMVSKIPVDTGRLRSTHYTSPPTSDGNGVFVEVGVGTDYAVAVHEKTEAVHQTGQAKFLEAALNEQEAGFVKRLGERIEAALMSGSAGMPAVSSKASRSAVRTESKGRRKSGKRR